MKTNRIFLYVTYSSSVSLMFLTPEYLKLVFVTVNAPVSISTEQYLRTI
jgi:hypothetical protein